MTTQTTQTTRNAALEEAARVAEQAMAGTLCPPQFAALPEPR